MCAGPILGWLVGAHPWHRSTMVLDHRLGDRGRLDGGPGLAGRRAALAAGRARRRGRHRWPGVDDRLRRRPHLEPAERFASASGIINQGGFLASLILVIAIGLILDWRTPGDSAAYTPEAFRWAMSAQYVLWAVGLVQVYRYRVRTRRVVDRDELEGVVTTPAG